MPSLIQRIASTGKRCYCVTFTLRSGSTLLCDDLRAMGFGAPTEYFQEPLYLLSARPASDYIVEQIEQTSGPWFGFKINWPQANSLIARLAAEGECRPDATIWSVFPGLRTVHLTREDKVLQAVSGWRANETNVWHVRAGEAPDGGRPVYDYNGIRTYFDAVVTEEWFWHDRFQSLRIAPIDLRYEDYIADRKAALRRIASQLGEPVAEPPAEDFRTMMRDDWSHDMAARFRATTRGPDHAYYEIWSRQVAELRRERERERERRGAA